MSDSLVIIPTYNEKENIEKMIRKVLSLEPSFHVLLVDDGSPDGTGQIIKDLQKTFPDKLFLIERSGKLGLGTAYIAGFQWALAHHYHFIFLLFPFYNIFYLKYNLTLFYQLQEVLILQYVAYLNYFQFFIKNIIFI